MLYELLCPFAQRTVVHDLLRTYNGSVSLHLALLAQAMGKLDAAARHFEDALAMNARIGGRPFLARTQSAFAGMLLDQAMTCVDELGLVEVRRKATELRRRAAERPAAAARRPAR